MKKYISISLAIMALTLAGCAGGPFSEEDVNVITIKAVMAENNTRTVIQNGTTSVLWEQADEIKVFYDGIGSRFANQNTSPSGTAKFSGSLNVVFGSNEGFSDSTPLWGLYPYRADATADNTSVTTTLPAEQTGRAGSFAKGTNITLGKSSSLVMGFYNVCGGIRFSLTQEGVKEVVFEGQNNESLAGKVKIAFVDGVPSVQEVVEGQKTITLTAPGGGTFETGKWYYIVALPGTLSNGFKMTFNTATQYATLKSSGSKTIKRGIFGSLADADEDLIYKDKEGGEPQSGNIVFADLAAKYACVAKFDTNGDGEVSIEEAEAATSFDGLFDDWKGVVSFDEISYFKNVHSLNGVFNGCNKLVSITIPESITDLGTYAFSECSSLSSVVLSSGISSIGNYTFQNCKAISSIDIPSCVTSVGQYAFSGCSSLSTIGLPSGVVSIADYAFQKCSSLSSIDIPSSVTSLGQYAFSDCSSLTRIIIPAGVTMIPAYCFLRCRSLISVTIPDGITAINNFAFHDVKMWKLELPSSVTSLGSCCFGSILCVIVPSTSPITIQSGAFDGVQGIFVPSNLIERYALMTNWANYALRLHPIDSYKEKNEFTLATSGAVDMGTTVKWAAYNVGANKPEGFGDYYAWGETQTKKDYSWTTYLDSPNRDGESFTKYFVGEGGKTELEPEDDVAHIKWGENWRMPAGEEWTDLLEKCMWEWITYEGIKGYMVYGFGDYKTIFLPAAGGSSGGILYEKGNTGYYWSSSLNSASQAWLLEFDPYVGYSRCLSHSRSLGCSIRPVCE